MPTLVIIGNGITGITAARHARICNPDLRIQIVSSESDYFYSRTALMYIYMGHMRQIDTEPYARDFYAKNRLELLREHVQSIDAQNKRVRCESGSDLSYDYLLIATGATPNRFGWPGQDLERVQGLYSLQDLEKLEAASQDGIRRAVIVGGGLIGIELAEMLHTRHIPVTFLVREANYWDNVLPMEEATLINEEIDRHGMELRRETELKEIIGDNRGRATAVVTGSGDRIECDLVGLTAGVSPNIKHIEMPGVESARGILVNAALETNVKDVYAAGDCAQFRDAKGKPAHVEQLWYTGRMQGEVVGTKIARRALLAEGKSTSGIPDADYDRGVWFNSAKFLTIEYQTYGFVPNAPDPERTWVWQDRKNNRLVRLIWDVDETGKQFFTGINILGVRMRQDVCTRWIREKRDIPYVIDHLKEGLFNPEFYPGIHKKLKAEFLKAA